MLNYWKGIISSAFLLMTALTLSAQSRLYVRANSSCINGCGGSWANAYSDLQDALAEAESDAGISEIWVAQGTYRPAASDRSISFDLPGGIDLLGGFAGEGANPDSRNTSLYPSILSGDLNQDDQAGFGAYGDNSYHVVITDGIGASLLVDGFTIQGGNASNSGDSKQDDGGGWYNSQYKGTASPTISNCTFIANRALNDGGAFFNGGSYGNVSPSFTQCTFIGNQAKSGGAFYNNGNSNTANPVFSRCLFQNNQASGSGATGGVLYSFSRAGSESGIPYAGNVSPSFSNCIFSENSSGNSAGTLYFLADGSGGTATSASTIENCSFYGNNASVGGAVYLNASNNGDNTANISNCIFWNSLANTDPIFHYSSGGAGSLPSINIAFSLVDTDNCDNLIRDGMGSVNCTDLLFYTDPGTAVFTDAGNGDFHLLSESPAVNAGSNALVSSGTDFAGQTRIQQTTVDLGAYELETVLPVELLYFEARPEVPDVRLQWETVTELNNDFFTLEHSVDGIQFRELQKIKGAGTSQVPHYYEFTDEHPLIGNNYYRLRQTDFDGSFTFSEIQVAEIQASGKEMLLYPNPVGDYLQIEWSANFPQHFLFEMMDQWGHRVLQGTLDLREGRKQLSGLNQLLPAGIYFLRIEDQVFRVVKQ